MTPERLLELRIERRILNTDLQRIGRRIVELDEIGAAFASAIETEGQDRADGLGAKHESAAHEVGDALQRQLRQHLPGYSVSVTPKDGELHVHVSRSYSLTISNPDGKISVERIVENAVRACSQ